VNKTRCLVIIGRPNVGKSTLFNRLYGQKRALVHDRPGVTRDRLEERAEWWVKAKRYDIDLIDTGGVGGEKFDQEIREQVSLALEKADGVLILFDAQSGLTPLDEEVVLQVKRSNLLDKVPVYGVVNKVDDVGQLDSLIAEFYQTGLERIVGLSAEHNRGVEYLKDELIDQWEKQSSLLSAEDPLDRVDDFEESSEAEEAVYEPRMPKIAIVGKPNVGKSTFLNALLREKRMITSPIAGTTVDAVDSLVELNGETFVFIDTAGIRRKNKTDRGIEVLSVVQAKKALDRADLAILVLDGEEGPSDQDEKIGGLVEESGCSVILAINKWDTQKGNTDFTQKEASERIRKRMPFLNYAPMLFMSALKGKGFQDLGFLVSDILNQRNLKLTTHEFTEFVKQLLANNNPNNAKVYMCHQSGRNPPSFICHVNDPDKIHFSLKRHIINEMRARWGFMGSPIRLSLRQRWKKK
jgi:GTPase